MPPSRTNTTNREGRPVAAALLVLLAWAAPPSPAAQRTYYLELHSSPTSVAPLLSRFGTIDLHVYSGGVRAESMWLDSFSRNGSPTVTLLNPIARMYAEVGVEDLPKLIAQITGIRRSQSDDVPRLLPPIDGKVNGVAARRYRLQYDATDWIDVWTTSAVPENPQLRRLADAFVRHFAPATAVPLARIPGNPLYVELNTREHPKFPLLQMRSLRFSDSGQSEALRVGSWYFKAPLIDAIFR